MRWNTCNDFTPLGGEAGGCVYDRWLSLLAFISTINRKPERWLSQSRQSEKDAPRRADHKDEDNFKMPFKRFRNRAHLR